MPNPAPAAPAATSPAPAPAIDLPESHQISDTYFAPAKQPDPTPAPAATKTDDSPPAKPEDKPPDDRVLTPKDFAKDRHSRKEEKKALEAKAQTADELAAERDQIRAELETIRRERDQLTEGSRAWENKQKEWEALQKDLNAKVEAADKRYFNEYGPTYNADEDEVVTRETASYFGAFDDVTGRRIEGERIPDLAAIRADRKKGIAMDQAIAAYIQAGGDDEAKEKAVQNLATVFGMENASEEYLERLEGSIRRSMTHAQAIIARRNEITANAPQLAQQAWQQRHSTWADRMLAITRLDNQKIEHALQDPSVKIGSRDWSLAAAAVMVNETGAWKAAVEPELARDAEALAMINARYQPPPLMSNDPAEIARHAKNVQELIARQAEIADNAAFGRVMLHALPALFARLADLEARAEESAATTNPKTGGKGKDDPVKGGDPHGAIPDNYEAHLRR